MLEEGFVGLGGTAQTDDFDADFGALEGFVFEDGLDVGLEIGAEDRG